MSGKFKYRLFLLVIICLATTKNTILAQDGEQDSTSTSSFLSSEVHYFATDSSQIDIQNKKVFLYHQAQVNYEDIELQAEHIILNWNDNTVYAIGLPDSTGKIIGEPIFKEGGKTYYCESILYNFNSKKGKIKGLKTQDGEGYIHGDELKKNSDNSMFVQESKYTTCSHDEPHFYINAKKIKIIPNKKIVSGPANLVIADIPTPLFIPFGFFPIQDKQSSGFIMPNYGYSVNRGYNLRNGGWYFSINEYIDLALRGDIFSLGSWQLKTQSTYKKRYAYHGNFSLSYSKNLLGERGLPNFEDRRDFFINWTHTQDSKAHPNRRFSAKVNAGSSSFNQLNSTVDNNYLKNTLTSNISYSYSWPGKPFNLSTNIRHSQNTLNNALSLSLPDMAFNINVKLIVTIAFLIFCGGNIVKAQDDFSDDIIAQETTAISGTVRDASTGDPIAGANVIVEDTDLGAATDEDGNFTIEDVSLGSELTASVIGYENQSIFADTENVVFELVKEVLEMSQLEVLASRAGDKTAVAYSDVSKEEIALRLGSQDIPLALNTVPSVYSTNQGGGAGGRGQGLLQRGRRPPAARGAGWPDKGQAAAADGADGQCAASAPPPDELARVSEDRHRGVSGCHSRSRDEPRAGRRHPGGGR